ncbi:DUF7927 domain-containing protein [Vibrio alginolyticus]
MLPYASYNDDAVAVIGGLPAGAVVRDGAALSWSGALAVGETATITYSVTVEADGVGHVLENSASATADPARRIRHHPAAGTTTNARECSRILGVEERRPGGGTAVDPGSVITYTVTGVNTGETVLDPVAITDEPLRSARPRRLQRRRGRLIGTTASTAPVVSGDSLSWTGALPVGETVTITYSVTVQADAGGAILENSASGSATPPGGVPPIETPPATTEHPVNEPASSSASRQTPRREPRRSRQRHHLHGDRRGHRRDRAGAGRASATTSRASSPTPSQTTTPRRP